MRPLPTSSYLWPRMSKPWLISWPMVLPSAPYVKYFGALGLKKYSCKIPAGIIIRFFKMLKIRDVNIITKRRVKEYLTHIIIYCENLFGLCIGRQVYWAVITLPVHCVYSCSPSDFDMPSVDTYVPMISIYLNIATLNNLSHTQNISIIIILAYIQPFIK